MRTGHRLIDAIDLTRKEKMVPGLFSSGIKNGVRDTSKV
jgi:hypothetical protein